MNVVQWGSSTLLGSDYVRASLRAITKRDYMDTTRARNQHYFIRVVTKHIQAAEKNERERGTLLLQQGRVTRDEEAGHLKGT
jgi:precorrin-6x reductase